jgi:predicted nucleic acid-binding Zn ribbon protein
VRKHAPRSLSVALERLASSLEPATPLARVQKIWEAAVGPAIAAAARPSAEHDGVLTVTCSAAVWAQELDLMSGDLVSRLNTALDGDVVRELRCRTG